MTSEHAAIFGDIATWLTAIGTVGALIIAFKQIHTERHERKKRQKYEDKLLEQEQARHISAWIDTSRNLVISNTSSHPIHNICIKFSSFPEINKHTIGPGEHTERLPRSPANISITDFTFTDTHGAKWRKIPSKKLDKISN